MTESEPELPEPPPDTPKKKKKRRKQDKPEPETTANEPETESAEEPSEEKPKKEKKPGFFKRLKPHSLSDVLGLVKDGAAALSPSLRFLFRHFHFRHFRLWMAVAAGDPSDTALLYGKLCAAAFNLLAQLQLLFDFETDEFRVLADFYGEKTDFKVSAELRVSPAVLLLTLLILGIKFLWRSFLRFRREDKEAALREKETAPA